METRDRQAHWGAVYTSKDETAVSWFQENPETSLRLIEGCSRPGANVVDVGAGASRLIDHLVDRGYRVTALDIARAALDKTRARLGHRASEVNWIAADVTGWCPPELFDVWHDRAVFHFLTDERDRLAYAGVLAAAVRTGGWAVIGTFAPDGPERCSDLPVCRYDARSLAGVFARDFTLVDELAEGHLTPSGKTQRFQFSVLRRL
ncbi:MAG: class I SAM-dependent methyltransferase [Alphaproteobacteria bacterium]